MYSMARDSRLDAQLSSARSLESRLAQAKEHKLAIRRLVMERVLFSEIQAFEDVKQRNQDLVYRITQDIGQTLAFFNFTAPAMIASAYALLPEGKELWRNRHRLDTLALFYPVAAFVCRKIFVAIMGLERKTSLKKQYVLIAPSSSSTNPRF